MLFLSGCFLASGLSNTCPDSRKPDEKVAEELDQIPFEGFEDFWDWMASVEVLNEQLDACD